MKFPPALVVSLAALLLATGCTPAVSPSNGAEESSQPQQEMSSTPPTDDVSAPAPTAPAFTHSDSFYMDLGRSLDIVMAPLFWNAQDLTPRQQSLYFPFFVDREGLFNAGANWWDETDRVYRIPLADIETVLQHYLGVEEFDPIAAYGTDLRKVEYSPIPLGYYPEEQQYVVYQLNGWGGARNTQLLSKEKLEDGSVRITVGFFDFGEIKDQTPYKRRVYTLWENPADPNDYRLLSLVDIHNVDGQELVVADSESHLNLRQPEEPTEIPAE